MTVAVPGCRVQKFKICVGNHPDDVKKWIEERKRKFPTRDNVAKRAERRARRKLEGGIDRVGGTVRHGRPKDAAAAENCAATDPGGASAGVPGEAGSASQTGSRGEDQKKASNALLNLMAGYGSSSSDDSDDDDGNSEGAGTDAHEAKQAEMQAPAPQMDVAVTAGRSDLTMAAAAATDYGSKTLPDASNATAADGASPFPGYRTKPCRFYVRNGSCRNGSKCTYLHDNAARESYLSTATERRARQSERDKTKAKARREVAALSGGHRTGTFKPGEATLLRKLLDREVKRESSLTLQCLRYIVDCNFLQEKRNEKVPEGVEAVAEKKEEDAEGEAQTT